MNVFKRSVVIDLKPRTLSLGVYYLDYGSKDIISNKEVYSMPSECLKTSVKVTYVESPSKFYVHYESNFHLIANIMDALVQFFPIQPKILNANELFLGKPVASLYSGDNLWYRALVTAIFYESVSVMLILETGKRSLCDLKPELIRNWRCQAVECCLIGSQNVPYDSVVGNEMEKQILNRTFELNVYSLLMVLECRVCEDVFTVQGERVPRLLYCGHTVCHSCLLRLPLKDDSILCPFDRQPTPVGSTGVWGLKKNFALLELIEKLELTDKETSIPDGNVLRNDSEANVGRCDEDESHTAVLYCVVCRSHLCELCSVITHATRTLAPHKRVPLADKPRDLPRCQAHPAHIAEFVCLKEECRTPTVCYLCKEYGRHKDHPHSLVEAEAEKLRTMVSIALERTHQLIEQMNQTERRLDEVVIGIEGNGEDIGGTLESARSRIEHHFEELRAKLEMQETTARSAVETHARERMATLRASQQDIATWLAQVMSVVVLCETSLSHDDTRLVSCGPQLKKALESIEKQHDQFNQLSPEQFNPDIPITFTKDNRVHIGPKIEMRVVALGLDSAGKTSILFKLKQNEFMSCRSPTIGFNVEPIEYKNLRFNIWDIGGQPKLRPLWKHYFLNTQAVVFVVDSNDKERLPEAGLELAKLVAEKELKEAALLILANKQDIDGCEGLETITELLGASKLCCGHSWHLQACSARTGVGLYQGLDWLSSQLVASPVTNFTSISS